MATEYRETIVTRGDDNRKNNEPPRKRANTPPWWLWISFAVAMLIIGALIWWVILSIAGNGTPSALASGATVQEVTTYPTRYYKQVVTVSGEVTSVLGPHAFVIGGQQYAGGGLLVASQQPVSQLTQGANISQISAGDVVQVTGVVYNWTVAAARVELKVPFNSSTYGQFDGQPAIYARQIQLTPLTSQTGAGGALTNGVPIAPQLKKCCVNAPATR